MFWSKNSIIEKISKISNTLDDISADIFSGVNTDNEYLHKLKLSEDPSSETPYLCMGLNKGINLERELVYPFIDSASSNEYAVHPSTYCFMLPYEIKGNDLKKGCRLLEPEELKTRYPLTYSRITKFKTNFKHDSTPLSSTDYSIQGCKLLQYINTPKIIVSDSYSFQASFDADGKYIFENGCGIVLKDSSKYFYVLAALNSSISRVFSEICQNDRLYNGNLTPGVLKNFPITFPKEKSLEDLVSVLSSYLTFIHSQIDRTSSDIPEDEDYELLKFYERIVNLLVLDTYFTNDLDPRFQEILVENLVPPEKYSNCGKPGFSGFEDAGCSMGELRAIKEKILNNPDFGKCRFNSEFTNILATLKNNGVW